MTRFKLTRALAMAVALTLSSAGARADCANEIEAAKKQYSNLTGLRGGQQQRIENMLRKAEARAKAGKEKGCLKMVESLKTLLANL